MNILSALPWLITAAGAYFLLKLRAFFILHPIKTLKPSLSGSASDLKALALALAGTLGVGNILGVSVGIAVGCAGAVFWLLVSSVFSSVIKYSEVSLSVSEAKLGGRGLVSIIKRSFGIFGKPLSSLFCLLCLLLAFFMGGALQCSAIASAAYDAFEIKPFWLTVLLLLLVIFLTFGEDEKIEKCSSVIIPLTTIIYISMCLCVILSEFSRLPQVLCEIFKGAFSPSGAGGGILGFLISKPMSEGYARGILSNEAGAGTSSFAHIRSTGRSPHAAGIFGIIEVIFDTVFLCSITAFTILLGLPEEALSGEGLLIAQAITGKLGSAGGMLLLLCVTLFALATVICWYYYGSVCFDELSGGRFMPIYKFLFLLSIPLGILYNSSKIILITDILLFSLSLITLSTLFINRKKIFALYKN